MTVATSNKFQENKFTNKPFLVLSAMCEPATTQDANYAAGLFAVKKRRERPRSNSRQAARKHLFRETDGHCLYCGIRIFLPTKNSDGYAQVFTDTATIDHIVPLSKGGTNLRENLAISCADCNHRKGDTSLFKIMRAKLEIAKRNRYLEVEKNLRVRASCWFNLDTE